MLLFPPSAAHPLVAIERDLYAAAGIAAVGAAFLPPEVAARQAATQARRFDAAARVTAGTPAAAVWTALAARARRVLEAEHLDAPPDEPRRDPSAEAWCPQCGAEYRAGVPVCSDCLSPLARYLA